MLFKIKGIENIIKKTTKSLNKLEKFKDTYEEIVPPKPQKKTKPMGMIKKIIIKYALIQISNYLKDNLGENLPISSIQKIRENINDILMGFDDIFGGK